MAAPLGFKTFATGDVLSAADTNGYLMQGVLVFANAAARTAAITSPEEGQTSYLKDTDVIQVYSGSAWVTKSGGSPLTTKGDLYTYSTTDARLPIGTNNHVLTADSTQATGMKWAEIPTPGALPTFRAYSNEDQSLSANTLTKKLYQVEDWDTASCFASSRFTPNVAGYYVLTATQYNPDAGTISLFFYKNGSNNSSGPSGGTPGFRAQNTTIMYFNGTTDYAEVYVVTNQTSLYNGSQNAYFTAVGVRS
jgi:hypothetical protein